MTVNGEDAAYVDIVFDGPPGPEAGRFIEVENERGESIRYGEWVQRADGYWCLRVVADQATYEWAMDWCGVHEGQRNDPEHGDEDTCDMGSTDVFACEFEPLYRRIEAPTTGRGES